MTDAIILAAGNSKRFGKDNKLFTDFNSTLLITHVVSEICKSKLRNIIVITGKDHVKINKLLKRFRVQVIKNFRFNEGSTYITYSRSFYIFKRIVSFRWDGNSLESKRACYGYYILSLQ